jgi:GNAT superfamily N-acetyltransferase
VLTIRRYRPADQQAVWSLHHLGLHQAGAHAGDGPWDDDLRQIESVYLSRGGEFLVGVDEGRLVAMGALRRRSAEVAEIKRMRVHPDVQRRGYGRAILVALERRARELGYARLELDTTTRQQAAIALYQGMGSFRRGAQRWLGWRRCCTPNIWIPLSSELSQASPQWHRARSQQWPSGPLSRSPRDLH